MKNKYARVIAVLSVIFLPITVLILFCWLLCDFLGLILFDIYEDIYGYFSKEKD